MFDFDQLDAWIANLDHADPKDRARVLEAIEACTMGHVVPANCGGEQGFESLSLTPFVGEAVSGLAVDAVFLERFPNLSLPADEVLQDALHRVGLEIDDPVRRAAFFRCWAGIVANAAIHDLLRFLARGPAPSREIRDREIETLVRLLANSLPHDLKFFLLRYILTHARDRASSLRDRTSDPYVKEVLSSLLR